MGCAASRGGAGGGRAESSCVRLVEYESRTYADVASMPITAGERLGSVTFTPCDDMGGRSGGRVEPPIKAMAYRVEGLDVDVAIAVGDDADDAELFAVKSGSGPGSGPNSGSGLPPEVEKFIDAS
ncbi:DUF6281 family protein [Streptomyces venezuelae]|uniref:DUF6281 family protein n=1 Tax=Streptomyces venezuelae TaxID=54571 RepID=UPI0037A6DF14